MAEENNTGSLTEEEAAVEELAVAAEEAEDLSNSAVEDYVIRDGVIVQYNGVSTAITLPLQDKDGNAVTRLSEAVFANNKTILSVTLPNNIALDDGAFRNCTSLLSVSMHNSITEISAECFEGCTALQSVSWPENLVEIGHDAFSGCTALTGVPTGTQLTTLGDNAFKNCSKLTYADLPNTLKTIGQGAFAGCTSLKEIIIPASVQTLGNRAFENCSGATKLVLPTTTKSITNYCFSGCSGLKEIKIPEGVVEIGREAFAGCSSASMIRLPKSLLQVGNDAFTGHPSNGWIRWDECQTPKDKVYLGNNALGTAGYVLAPVNTAAQAYCDKYKNVYFCSTSVRDFVIRCYNEILKRNNKIDEPGMLDWCGQIASGKKGGSAIVKSFIDSKEFTEKKYSDTQVVTILYKAMLNRDPDAAGLASWLEKLNCGVTYDRIIYGFTTAPEFVNLCKSYLMTPGAITLAKYRDKNWQLTAFVSRCYTECLGRKYDVNGLEDWCKLLQTNKRDVVELVKGFFLSKEFTDKKLSDTEYVHRLYRTLFGRDEDAVGMQTWLKVLANKKTREFVLEEFVKSAEFKKHCDAYGLKVPDLTATKKKKKK